MGLGGRLSTSWTPEISAAILSISALGALIGVLDYANGTVVHSWHGITLNAVVSVLATISKMAATFVVGSAISQAKWCLYGHGPQPLQDFETIDQASRGALGCIPLLWKARKLVYLGASAVVLAVIFDPFAQQLVHYGPDVLYTPKRDATIPRATRYSAGNRVVVGISDTGAGPSVNANADYSMQSAVTSALVQPLGEIVQQLQLSCRSGNCTWPTIESLAICSSCNDVHSYLSMAESHIQLFDFLSINNPAVTTSPRPISRPTLPNTLSIDKSVQMTTFGTGDPAKTVTMRHIDTLIFSMTVLKVKNTSENRSALQYEAVECALRYCVRQYNSKVTNNRLEETSDLVKDAIRDPDSWSIEGNQIKFYTSKKGFNETITTAEKNSLDFNSTAAGFSRSDLRLGGKYNISQTAVDGIGSLFYDTFTYDTYQQGINGFYIAGSSTSAQYDPPAINQIWASQSLEETFETLAVSMSNAIRAGSDNREIESGQEGSLVTKFRIEWPWITLPILVVLTSLAQLLVSILSSRSVPLWKASTLAVLSRGKFLDGLLDQASSLHEMQEVASGTKVHLFEHKAELQRETSSTGYSSLLQK